MRSSNTNIIPVQAGATITSAAISVDQVYACSASFVATSTLAGTFKLMASNDPASSQSPGNFVDIPNATVSVIGTPGVFLIPYTSVAYQWLQVVFTKSGGSGNMTAYLKTNGN